MLTAQQFKERWQNEIVAIDSLPDDVRLIAIPAEKLVSVRLSDAARQFLIEAGLPKACAPCLSFDEIEKGLSRLWEVFSPGQWQPKEKIGLENYLIIGSDDAGNPFCIDEVDGKIVLVEHEVLFDLKWRNKMVTFVNSGIPQFAESLLVYQNLTPEEFQKSIRQIDAAALDEAAFWTYQHNDESNEGLFQKFLRFVGVSV